MGLLPRQVLTVGLTLIYDAENRLVSVTGAATASFSYDGDGRQVKSVVNGVTTYYVGNHYEKKGTTVTKYYFAGATRLAVRTGGTLRFLLGDHLGSSSVTTDANGVQTASALYKAFGETRYTLGNLGTDYKFTGQREEAALGIYFFNARWLDPVTGRFAQADTIVPTGTQGTQAWDRYGFVNNNPVRYNDPTGHQVWDGDEGGCTSDSDCNPPPSLELILGLHTNACHMYACTSYSQQGSSAHDGYSGNPPANAGWQSPEFIFNRIDLGVWVMSGSYQIEGSINNESSITLTNNDVQVGPIGVDFSNSELFTNSESIPGMSINLIHPGFSFDAHSTADFGNLHLDQTLSINAEFRWEAPAALAVLAGGYEAILYLLGAAAGGQVLQPAFP